MAEPSAPRKGAERATRRRSRAQPQRPANWRELTGERVGQPPKIFDRVRVQRPIPNTSPVQFREVELPITEAICDFLRAGVPIYGSCESLGVTAATYHNWRAKGEEDRRGGRSSVYVEFLDASTRAIAESQVTLVLEMRNHGRRDPRATEYLLRNRFPKDFGERHRLEVAMAEEEIPDDVVDRTIREAYAQIDDVIDVPGVSAEERRALAAENKRGKKNGKSRHR